MNDVHRLGRLDIDAGEVLVLQNDEFPLLVFIAFHDLVPRHLFAVGLGHALVIHRAVIRSAKQAKLQFLAPQRGKQGDGDINQTEADRAFPDGSHDAQFTPAKVFHPSVASRRPAWEKIHDAKTGESNARAISAS